MDDNILTPLSAFKPGLYKTSPVSDAVKSQLAGLTPANPVFKYKGLRVIDDSDYSPQPLYNLVYKLEERSEWSDGTWFDATRTGEIQYTCDPSYFSEPIIFGPPASSGARYSPIGGEASILCGFNRPRKRSKRSRPRKLEYYVLKETRRLQRFRKHWKHRVDLDEQLREATFQKWHSGYQNRLAAMKRRLVSLNTIREKTDQDIYRLSWQVKGLDFFGKETSRKRDKLTRLEEKSAAYAKQIERLKGQIQDVERKSEPSNFRWDPVVVPEYKCLWYDFQERRVLQPQTALPEKVLSYAKDPHPVDHLKMNRAVPQYTDVNLVIKHSRSDGYGEDNNYISLKSTVPTAGLTTLAWGEPVVLNPRGAFSYSSYDLREAVSSLVLQMPQAASVPTFLLELKELSSTIAAPGQFISQTSKLLDRLRRLGRNNRRALRKASTLVKAKYNSRELTSIASDALKAYSGADLAKKFGYDPIVSDVLAFQQSNLNAALADCKKFQSWLKNRGKLLTLHRQVGDVKHTSREEEIPLNRMVPGSFEFMVQGGTCHYQECNDWSMGPMCYEFDEEPYNALSVLTNHLSYLSNSWELPPVMLREQTTDKLTLFCSYDFTDIWGWTLDDDSLARALLLDRLGFFIDPKVVWDRIPFSFVVDWLINVKSMLSAYEIRNVNPEYTVYGAMLSRKTARALVIPDYSNIRLRSGDSALEGRINLSCSGVYTTTRFQRQFVDIPSSYFDHKKVKVRFKPPSWWKLVTGVELLKS